MNIAKTTVLLTQQIAFSKTALQPYVQYTTFKQFYQLCKH